MSRRLLTLLLVFSFAVSLSAQKAAKPSAPDRAYLQAIWDGWATLDTANVSKFYAAGPHAFFDIAPLKYNSWDEYQAGVKKELADYKSAKFTVNDDVAIHPHGDLAWVTATVNYEMTRKAGNVEMGNFRWTAVFENQNGKWISVHEHVSAPIP